MAAEVNDGDTQQNEAAYEAEDTILAPSNSIFDLRNEKKLNNQITISTFRTQQMVGGVKTIKDVAISVTNTIDRTYGSDQSGSYVNATFEVNKIVGFKGMGFKHIKPHNMPTKIITLQGSKHAVPMHDVQSGWWYVEGRDVAVSQILSIWTKLNNQIQSPSLLPRQINFVFKNIRIMAFVHKDLDEFINLGRRPAEEIDVQG